MLCKLRMIFIFNEHWLKERRNKNEHTYMEIIRSNSKLEQLAERTKDFACYNSLGSLMFYPVTIPWDQIKINWIKRFCMIHYGNLFTIWSLMPTYDEWGCVFATRGFHIKKEIYFDFLYGSFFYLRCTTFSSQYKLSFLDKEDHGSMLWALSWQSKFQNVSNILWQRLTGIMPSWHHKI